MRTRLHLLLGALTAALVLAVAVGTANARRIALSNQTFRATWRGMNELTFEAGGIKVICEVTLEGSFHSRTLSKVSGQLIGYVTRARIKHPCTEREAWMLNGVEVLEREVVANTLPWHIQYNSFVGTLPRITRVRLAVIGESILASAFGFFFCLYRSTQAQPQFANVLTNEVGMAVQIQALPEGKIPPQEGLNCTEGSVSGTGVFRQLNSETSTVDLTLVQ